MSRSIEYNFNWCWYHAPHLKKKTLPVLENLVITSRTTTNVVSCLKISLTSMCVVVRTSSPGSRLRKFFILPPFPTSPPPELVFQSIEETLLQPALKSFITVFIQCNVGLENKLIRAPLLGLAKSTYYIILSHFMQIIKKAGWLLLTPSWWSYLKGWVWSRSSCEFDHVLLVSLVTFS